jgi:hypothetical protein
MEGTATVPLCVGARERDGAAGPLRHATTLPSAPGAAIRRGRRGRRSPPPAPLKHLAAVDRKKKAAHVPSPTHSGPHRSGPPQVVATRCYRHRHRGRKFGSVLTRSGGGESVRGWGSRRGGGRRVGAASRRGRRRRRSPRLRRLWIPRRPPPPARQGARGRRGLLHRRGQ